MPLTVKHNRLRAIGRISIARYFTSHDVPLICFSDMHFVAFRSQYYNDAPDAFIELLHSFPSHRILLLGDVLESFVPWPITSAAILESARLGPLFAYLRSCRTVDVIPGNHDEPSIHVFNEIFGTHHVWPGGIPMGRVRFVHGHECLKARTVARSQLAIATTQAVGFLRRNGLDCAPKVPNSVIASYYRPLFYPVFGHTHSPSVTRTFANLGAFLRGGPMTFAVIENHTLTLWQKVL